MNTLYFVPPGLPPGLPEVKTAQDAELAALLTLRQLANEHGEYFLAHAFAAVLAGLAAKPRTAGMLGRPCVSKRQAVMLLQAIHTTLDRRAG